MACKYKQFEDTFLTQFQAGNRKSLSLEAVDKLGSHVVDPNKKEKKPKDAPLPNLSDFAHKAHKYVAHLATVLPTLPFLPAPTPYPGTWEQVRKCIFIIRPGPSTEITILGLRAHRCKSARGADLWYRAHVELKTCRPSLNERGFACQGRRYCLF